MLFSFLTPPSPRSRHQVALGARFGEAQRRVCAELGLAREEWFRLAQPRAGLSLSANIHPNVLNDSYGRVCL